MHGCIIQVGSNKADVQYMKYCWGEVKKGALDYSNHSVCLHDGKVDML